MFAADRQRRQKLPGLHKWLYAREMLLAREDFPRDSLREMLLTRETTFREMLSSPPNVSACG